MHTCAHAAPNNRRDGTFTGFFRFFYPSLGSCQAKGMVSPHQKHTAPGWPKILPQQHKDFLWSCLEWPLLQGKVAYMAYIFGLRQKLSCHPGTSSVFREHANEHDLDGGNIRTFTSLRFLQEMDLKETLDYLWRSIPCEYPRMQIHWYSIVGGLLLTCPHKPCSTHAEQIWPQPRDFACATWQSSVLLAA